MKMHYPCMTAFVSSMLASYGCAMMPSQSEGGTLCKQMTKVIDAIPQKFENLKGPQVGKGTWDTTVPLPNMRECSVEKHVLENASYYSCDRLKTGDLDAAEASYTALTSQVKACIPPDWKTREIRRSGSMSTRFTPPVDDISPPSVTVRAIRYSDGFWAVKVEADHD